MPGVTIIEEHPSDAGGRLGRHVHHDPRSRHYAFSASRAPGPLRSVEHPVHIPVLDQGSLGSCTGNAAEACAGSSPLYAAIPANVTARPTADADADERQAVALYTQATTLDDVPGQYPPHDTGSTGLAVAKAAQRAGLVSGYQHALSLEAALQALAVTPVIVGVNWYEGFDRPDGAGLVTVSGQVRGGHEFLLYGIDADERRVLARNSWGTAWGAQGGFRFSFDDLDRLLHEDGDCTVLVPLHSPATGRVPAQPTPQDVENALVATLGSRLADRH